MRINDDEQNALAAQSLNYNSVNCIDPASETLQAAIQRDAVRVPCQVRAHESGVGIAAGALSSARKVPKS